MILGIFSAIGRYLTAVGYFFTGQIEKARRTLETDPNVIAATYDQVLREKKARIQEFMSAVASLIHQQEKKKQEKARLEEEAKRQKAVMAGALALAQRRVAVLQGQGKTAEEIKSDAEVLKHQGAYMDMKSSVAQKESRIVQLDQGIVRAQEQIDKHKINLEKMQREIADIRAESADAVANVISAQEEKALADMLTGLSTTDTTGERLASVRDAVGQVQAEARVASELAGTNAQVSEAQYLAQAAEAQASSEFAALLNLAEKVESGSPAVKSREAAATERLS